MQKPHISCSMSCKVFLSIFYGSASFASTETFTWEFKRFFFFQHNSQDSCQYQAVKSYSSASEVFSIAELKEYYPLEKYYKLYHICICNLD